MSEQKINVELLEEVKALILEEPRRLRMEVVASSFDDARRVYAPVDDVPGYRDEDRPPCNAVMCIAGHANYAVMLRERPDLSLYDPETEESNWNAIDEMNTLSIAGERLGLDAGQRQRLFYLKSWGFDEGWPRKFERQFLEAKTPAGRARIAARRIDHFIKTNGAE